MKKRTYKTILYFILGFFILFAITFKRIIIEFGQESYAEITEVGFYITYEYTVDDKIFKLKLRRGDSPDMLSAGEMFSVKYFDFWKSQGQILFDCPIITNDMVDSLHCSRDSVIYNERAREISFAYRVNGTLYKRTHVIQNIQEVGMNKDSIKIYFNKQNPIISYASVKIIQKDKFK